MLLFKLRRSLKNGSVYFFISTLLIALRLFVGAELVPNSNDDSKSSHMPSKPANTLYASQTSTVVQQANANPIIRKHAISDLTHDLDIQLKSIQDHELLIPAIQNVFDLFERMPSTIDHNETKMLNSIATKIEAKLSAGLRILNETSYKFTTILSENSDQSKQLMLDTIILPCSNANAKHSERSTHDSSIESSNQSDFIAGINKKKAIEVLNFLKNAGHLHETDDRNFTINKRLMATLKSIDLSTPNVPNFRDVFFLPRYSHVSSTNCRNTVLSEHHRFLYASSTISKRIVLMLDVGSTATNSESFDLIKSYAQVILNLLNDDDQLILMAVSNSVHTIDGPTTFYSMNSTSKIQIRKFIDSLEKETSSTNHSMAFQYAFDWIASQFDTSTHSSLEGKSIPLQILYVSRGITSQSSEIKNVLEAISVGQSRMKQPVVINACAIVLNEFQNSHAHAEEFLTDIAVQNYTKYGIDVTVNITNSLNKYNNKGNIFIVNNQNVNDMLSTATAAITDSWFEIPFLKSQIIIHLPFYDPIIKDQVIYITKSSAAYGIVGISMYLSDIAEDIIYHFNQYSNGDETYAFLCDINGMTIWHPSFQRPNIASYDPTYATDIRYFEKTPENIRDRWLSEGSGIVQISKASAWNRKKSKVYRWRRLSDWYIVCLVHVLSQIESPRTNVSSGGGRISTKSFHSYKEPLVLASASHTAASLLSNISAEMHHDNENKMIFHRLDLTVSTKLHEQHESAPKLCQYFKQISVLDTPTLFLSPRSFKSPFQHLTTMCDDKNIDEREYHLQCYHRFENIMAYIKDTTNLLTNPGLQPHVRSDVVILAHVIEMLRNQHQYRSKIEKYVVRRYITSMNGIMLMYPGFSLPNDFDPSRRSWFQKTMQNAGKLTITPPYLDIGGAGFIVTISYVIFERLKSSDAGTVNERQNPAAIVSMDVTLGFLYQVLLQSSDYCRSDGNIKCFLIDDYGYLVVYPSNFDSKMQLSLYDSQFNVNEHLTHRESLIANDILLHKYLVEKRMCQNLLNRKVERYYKFNTTVSGALTNFVNGERTKYQIEVVPNTNLFVIMKNSTEGGGGAAFCPCSTVDKVCFNCKRIELMNCECPCECSIDNLNTGSIITEYMYGDLLEDEQNTFDKKINLFDSVEVCSRPVEEFVPNRKTADKLSELSQCVNFTCELYSNQLDCLGILGCVWCEIDIDQTILLSPFCTHQSSCFGGTLGSNTPYGDGDIGVIIDSILPSAYAAIGPIAIAAVVVLFVVIGLAMYCYRNNLEPGTEHLYVESMAVEHNFGLPLSRLDYDTILPHNGLGHDVTDKQNNAGNVSSDSPYRSNYFRRLPNGESDHGYSTMTPHDDSDHACFTLVEPLINNKCSNQSISDSTSFNTEPANSCINYGPNAHNKTDVLNSPIKSHYEQTSELSSPHHIQAPVTVHHPMEAIL